MAASIGEKTELAIGISMKNYTKVLFPYAYNILGSVDDALDAIQEVMANFHTASKEHLTNEKNYLIRSVINQSINLKNKRKRLSSKEVWLPEPVSTEQADKNLELQEVASYSMLVLLEQLNSKERAVFILKEAFDHSHEEIAAFLAVTTENSRKLLSRAKSKIKPARENRELRLPRSREKLLSYVSAIRKGNVEHLKELLSIDVALQADGGPNINIAARRLNGSAPVSDLLLFVYRKYQTNFSIIPSEINHQPALLYYSESNLISCQVFEFGPEEEVLRISLIIDPEKLKNIHCPDSESI